MATINELLKEIDWDLYDDSDYEEDDKNMPSDELTLDNSSDKPVGQRRAELIIQSRMNIAARAKVIRREAANDDLTALVSRRQLNELIRIITLPDTENRRASLAPYKQTRYYGTKPFYTGRFDTIV